MKFNALERAIRGVVSPKPVGRPYWFTKASLMSTPKPVERAIYDVVSWTYAKSVA